MKLYEDNYLVKVYTEVDKINIEDISRDELVCLYAFVISLIKSGLSSEYCFSNYGEGRICIYKYDGCWYVYFTSNGTRYGQIIYDNCLECCIQGINLITINEQSFGVTVNNFLRMRCLEFSDEELSEFIKYFWKMQDKLTLDDERAFRDYRRKLSRLYKRY